MTHNFDWVSIFGTMGFISSQLMNFSIVPSILQIHSSKSTLAFSSFPPIIGITNSIHNILYASTRNNMFVIYSSSLSFSLNLIFTMVHLKYSKVRNTIYRQVVYFPIMTTLLALILVSLTRYFYCSPIHIDNFCDSIIQRILGSLSTIISTLSYCGQLSSLGTVLKTRNACSISPWITAGVAVRASSWFVFAILTNDVFYTISTSIGLLSVVTQIYLLVRYPRPTKLVVEKLD